MNGEIRSDVVWARKTVTGSDATNVEPRSMWQEVHGQLTWKTLRHCVHYFLLFGLWSQETLSTTAGKVHSHLDGSEKQRLERKPGFKPPKPCAETHFLRLEATSQNSHVFPKLTTGQEHGVLARKLIGACQSDPSWDPLASVDETGAPERWEICVGERTHL